MEKFRYLTKEKINNLPKAPGIYLFKKGRDLLYIGKAADIRERVKNHFKQPGYRDNLFISQVEKIGYIKTNSEIEALILEANLIKKYQPKYNVIWRDDKNYFYLGITKEDFPRIFITHQVSNFEFRISNVEFVGPFVDGKALKQTLKVLRKVFPYRSCRVIPKQPCLWYHLNRCPGPCLLKILSRGQTPGQNFGVRMKRECQKNAKNLMKILKEGKNPVLRDLKREMKITSKNQEFEEAAKIRDQIEALKKIISNAKIFNSSGSVIKMPWQSYYTWEELEKKLKEALKIKEKKEISRVEAYDVSNIQGQEATGSMITFINGQPEKNFYRKFKIKIVRKPNDVAMLKECLTRRLRHLEWGLPDLILIDGGKAQLNAAKQCLKDNFKQIRVIALAKKRNELYLENEKKPILLENLPRPISHLIIYLRDEAHRFAKKYHLKLRERLT